MNHKVAVICTHYNHLDIFPFVYDYWKLFANHIYIFDNGSNDGSLENFKKYSDYITVIDFSYRTGGKLNDTVNQDIKNTYWKELKNQYDYIMICDFDEVLYCDNLDRILDICDKNNIDLIYPKHCEMIDNEFKQYTPGKLYHELNPYCVNKNLKTTLVNKLSNDTKLYIINPKTTIETNFSIGQHHNTAISKNKTYMKIDNLYVFHLHYIGLDYVKKIYEKNKQTMSDENKRHNYGIQYNDTNDIDKCEERLQNKILYYNYKIDKYLNY